jgi:ribosomal-protein-alanine N-acetyltransferase
MANPSFRLTDGVVTIRRFKPGDKCRMAELANNRRIADNLRDAFPHPYSITDAEGFIKICLKMSPSQVFAIEFEGDYVGNIGLQRQDDVYRKTAELGYFLGEPYWNRGITTRAVKLICEYGFRELDIIKIFSGVFEYNLPSQRVLEKCGFVREAVLKDSIIKNEKIWDEYRYARYLSKHE